MRDDIDRIDQWKKKVGIEDCNRCNYLSIQAIHKEATKKSLTSAASNNNVNIMTSSKTTTSRKQKWEEKSLYR